MNYLPRALELQEETVAYRRRIHQHPEVGLDLPETAKFVLTTLRELGLEARQPIASGVTATIGRGGKVILLRADMDALPMNEGSGLPFASPFPDRAHTCGHDMHTAMLLTAARLLKENESQLQGTVKLMFQPAEETFAGSQAMLDAGILEQPSVDAALAFHVDAGRTPPGTIGYNDHAAILCSADTFKVTVEGNGSHGSYPHAGIDPINAATHIYQAYMALIAREKDPAVPAVLTIGQFSAGEVPNIIPGTAQLQGSIRTTSDVTRQMLKRRLSEIAQGIAASFGASATVEILSEVPPMMSDPDFTKQAVSAIAALGYPGFEAKNSSQSFASDDFARILERVPGSFMFLSAGSQSGTATLHNPGVIFNEDVLPFGAAALAAVATDWLAASE